MGAAGSTPVNLTDVEKKRARRRFEKLTGKGASMSIDDFIRNADLKDNEIMRRILMNFDQGEKCSISTDDFLSAMERMHQMHSADQRTRFLFQLYDDDKDGRVSPRDLAEVWSRVPGSKNMSEPAMSGIISSIFKEYDLDRDGHLSQSEFKMLTDEWDQQKESPI